jgi:hypothetical protein
MALALTSQTQHVSDLKMKEMFSHVAIRHDRVVRTTTSYGIGI